jgi:glycosyltransferase involved in cell wall biosynthesis
MSERTTQATVAVQPAITRWPFSISVVMPAYNEADGIAETVEGVRRVLPEAEVLVVDDCSADATAEAARAAGARVVRHPYNKGNGASVKTGVRSATGEIVLIVDADGQMNPAYIPPLLELLMQGYDLAIGARSPSSHASSLRRWGNALLNRLGSYLVEQEVYDLTSGFRAFRRPVMMEFIHLLPNKYSWPTTSTLAFAKGGYSVGFVPVTALRRQGGKSGQKLMRNGVRFGLIILRIVTLFSPLRVFFPLFVLLELLALIAYLWSVARGDAILHLPPSTVMFFLGGIVIFLFGLISEQIAALRFKVPSG